MKPLHYEIHVTVKTEEVNRFMEECGAIGVKPIVLDLQKQDGGSIQDVMTSSKLIGDDEIAFTYMRNVSRLLTDKGFNIVREKIETVPWHPKAIVHGKDSKEGYFETHFPVLVAPVYLPDLQVTAKNQGLHLSKNPFKVRSDGGLIQMATLRKNVALGCFMNWYKASMIWLDEHRFHVIKSPDVEYALHDSNVSHDSQWVGQNSPPVLV